MNRDQGSIVDNYSSNKSGLYAVGKNKFFTSTISRLPLIVIISIKMLNLGFGSLSSGGSFPTELRHVELAFVPRNTCNSQYNGAITDFMMCAADPGQDSCQGDSGKKLKNKFFCYTKKHKLSILISILY